MVSFITEALTVTELNRGIKQLLEENLGRVVVQGELSNLSRPSSGHLYFNIKDDNTQVAGVMFRSAAQRSRFHLENGMEMLLFGRITVYEPRGVYQLIIDRAEPLGAGALQMAFEQLKARLSAEGLFDADHKKPLPFLPTAIGVVTSLTGAAIRDILNVLSRRFPSIPVIVNPVSVQGNAAAGEIATAISQFQKIENIDLLIVGRGGGAIEDLWAFNEEVVARAIYNSRIPVISAVGHETDFTITDFVADLRAPTPSAAAELAVPVKAELQNRLQASRERLMLAMDQLFQAGKDDLNHYLNRLRSPEWVIQHQMQRVDELSGRLSGLIRTRLQSAGEKHDILYRELLFRSPDSLIESFKTRIQDLERRTVRQTGLIVEKNRNRLQKLTHVLNASSPLSIMSRGYAIVGDVDDRPVTSIASIRPNDRLSVRVSDGSIQTRVEEVMQLPPGSRKKKEP